MFCKMLYIFYALSTAINATPYELFNYWSQSTRRCSIPTWLSLPGIVLLKHYISQLKYNPVIEKTKLIEYNPCYVYICLQNDKEMTISIKYCLHFWFYYSLVFPHYYYRYYFVGSLRWCCNFILHAHTHTQLFVFV